ncbi:murein biosynthesis integral membrane protein MurJ [Paraclostridium sordellii]
MSKIAKSAVGLMVATLIAKVLGFGRELVLGSAYGVSSYTDAYVIAYNIPIIIFAIVGAALSTTFIPMYHDVESERGSDKALKFTNNIFNIVIILCILMATIGFIFTEPIVKMFAVGFKGETLAIAIEFTKIIIVGVIFLGLTYLMTAYLQIKGNFVIPGLISLPQNIIIIMSILLSVKYGVLILAYGSLLAMVSQFLFQMPFAIKHGYKYRPYLNIKDKSLKKMMILLGPVMIGIAVSQVNTVIDRNLASTLADGSIAALNYANKLNGFVVGMFIMSISAVIYPVLSKLSCEDNKVKFNETIVKTLNSIILIVLPVSTGAIVLANPIVKVLFERGEFDERATSMTAIALAGYSIGMIGLGVYDILSKVFFALKDTKTPLIVGTFIGVPLNIILNLILIRFIGHAGLALATSIATLIYTSIAFIALKRKIGDFGQNKVFITTIKSLIASILMGISSLVSYKFLIGILGNNKLNIMISLASSILIGAIIYGIIVIILKIEEVNFIINTIKNKIKK